MQTTDPFAPTTGTRGGFGADKEVGYTVTGVLIEDPQVVPQTDLKTGKPEYWDDGSPRTQVLVKLQTTLRDDEDDDGIRALYAKGGKAVGPGGGMSMHVAIAEASKVAGAPIRKGGTLTVKYVEQAEPKARGFDGQKLYKAKYEAAPPAAFAADDF